MLIRSTLIAAAASLAIMAPAFAGGGKAPSIISDEGLEAIVAGETGLTVTIWNVPVFSPKYGTQVVGNIINGDGPRTASPIITEPSPTRWEEFGPPQDRYILTLPHPQPIPGGGPEGANIAFTFY